MTLSLTSIPDFLTHLDATWVQNIILFIGLWLTIRIIKAQHEIARKQSTLQQIDKLRSDVKYIEAMQLIRQMRSSNSDPVDLKSIINDTRKTSEERQAARTKNAACRYVLASLDLLAIGIRLELLDGDIFKTYYYSTYVEIIEFLKNYIGQMRSQAKQIIENKQYVSQDTIHQDALWLLDRWKTYPLQDIERDLHKTKRSYVARFLQFFSDR